MSKKLITGGGPKDAVNKAVGFFINKKDWNLDKENEYIQTAKSRFLDLNINIIEINKSAVYSADINNIKNKFTEFGIELNTNFSDAAQAQQFVEIKLRPRSLPPAPPSGSVGSDVGPEQVLTPPPPPTDKQSGNTSAKSEDDPSILAKGGVGEGEKKPETQFSLRERITGLGVEVPKNFKDKPPGPEIDTAEIVSEWIVPAMGAVQNVHDKYYNATSNQMAVLNVKIDNVKLEDSRRNSPIFGSVERITIKRREVGGKRKSKKKKGTKKKKHKRK